MESCLADLSGVYKNKAMESCFAEHYLYFPPHSPRVEGPAGRPADYLPIASDLGISGQNGPSLSLGEVYCHVTNSSLHPNLSPPGDDMVYNLQQEQALGNFDCPPDNSKWLNFSWARINSDRVANFIQKTKATGNHLLRFGTSTYEFTKNTGINVRRVRDLVVSNAPAWTTVHQYFHSDETEVPSPQRNKERYSGPSHLNDWSDYPPVLPVIGYYTMQQLDGSSVARPRFHPIFAQDFCSAHSSLSGQGVNRCYQGLAKEMETSSMVNNTPSPNIHTAAEGLDARPITSQTPMYRSGCWTNPHDHEFPFPEETATQYKTATRYKETATQGNHPICTDGEYRSSPSYRCQEERHTDETCLICASFNERSYRSMGSQHDMYSSRSAIGTHHSIPPCIQSHEKMLARESSTHNYISTPLTDQPIHINPKRDEGSVELCNFVKNDTVNHTKPYYRQLQPDKRGCHLPSISTHCHKTEEMYFFEEDSTVREIVSQNITKESREEDCRLSNCNGTTAYLHHFEETMKNENGSHDCSGTHRMSKTSLDQCYRTAKLSDPPNRCAFSYDFIADESSCSFLTDSGVVCSSSSYLNRNDDSECRKENHIDRNHQKGVGENLILFDQPDTEVKSISKINISVGLKDGVIETRKCPSKTANYDEANSALNIQKSSPKSRTMSSIEENGENERKGNIKHGKVNQDFTKFDDSLVQSNHHNVGEENSGLLHTSDHGSICFSQQYYNKAVDTVSNKMKTMLGFFQSCRQRIRTVNRKQHKKRSNERHYDYSILYKPNTKLRSSNGRDFRIASNRSPKRYTKSFKRNQSPILLNREEIFCRGDHDREPRGDTDSGLFYDVLDGYFKHDNTSGALSSLAGMQSPTVCDMCEAEVSTNSYNCKKLSGDHTRQSLTLQESENQDIHFDLANEQIICLSPPCLLSTLNCENGHSHEAQVDFETNNTPICCDGTVMGKLSRPHTNFVDNRDPTSGGLLHQQWENTSYLRSWSSCSQIDRCNEKTLSGARSTNSAPDISEQFIYEYEGSNFAFELNNNMPTQNNIMPAQELFLPTSSIENCSNIPIDCARKSTENFIKDTFCRENVCNQTTEKLSISGYLNCNSCMCTFTPHNRKDILDNEFLMKPLNRHCHVPDGTAFSDKTHALDSGHDVHHSSPQRCELQENRGSCRNHHLFKAWNTSTINTSETHVNSGQQNTGSNEGSDIGYQYGSRGGNNKEQRLDNRAWSFVASDKLGKDKHSVNESFEVIPSTMNTSSTFLYRNGRGLRRDEQISNSCIDTVPCQEKIKPKCRLRSSTPMSETKRADSYYEAVEIKKCYVKKPSVVTNHEEGSVCIKFPNTESFNSSLDGQNKTNVGKNVLRCKITRNSNNNTEDSGSCNDTLCTCPSSPLRTRYGHEFVEDEECCCNKSGLCQRDNKLFSERGLSNLLKNRKITPSCEILKRACTNNLTSSKRPQYSVQLAESSGASEERNYNNLNFARGKEDLWSVDFVISPIVSTKEAILLSTDGDCKNGKTGGIGPCDAKKTIHLNSCSRKMSVEAGAGVAEESTEKIHATKAADTGGKSKRFSGVFRNVFNLIKKLHLRRKLKNVSKGIRNNSKRRIKEIFKQVESSKSFRNADLVEVNVQNKSLNKAPDTSQSSNSVTLSVSISDISRPEKTESSSYQVEMVSSPNTSLGNNPRDPCKAFSYIATKKTYVEERCHFTARNNSICKKNTVQNNACKRSSNVNKPCNDKPCLEKAEKCKPLVPSCKKDPPPKSCTGGQKRVPLSSSSSTSSENINWRTFGMPPTIRDDLSNRKGNESHTQPINSEGKGLMDNVSSLGARGVYNAGWICTKIKEAGVLLGSTALCYTQSAGANVRALQESVIQEIVSCTAPQLTACKANCCQSSTSLSNFLNCTAQQPAACNDKATWCESSCSPSENVKCTASNHATGKSKSKRCESSCSHCGILSCTASKPAACKSKVMWCESSCSSPRMVKCTPRQPVPCKAQVMFCESSCSPCVIANFTDPKPAPCKAEVMWCESSCSPCGIANCTDPKPATCKAEIVWCETSCSTSEITGTTSTCCDTSNSSNISYKSRLNQRPQSAFDPSFGKLQVQRPLNRTTTTTTTTIPEVKTEPPTPSDSSSQEDPIYPVPVESYDTYSLNSPVSPAKVQDEQTPGSSRTTARSSPVKSSRASVVTAKNSSRPSVANATPDEKASPSAVSSSDASPDKVESPPKRNSLKGKTEDKRRRSSFGVCCNKEQLENPFRKSCKCYCRPCNLKSHVLDGSCIQSALSYIVGNNDSDYEDTGYGCDRLCHETSAEQHGKRTKCYCNSKCYCRSKCYCKKHGTENRKRKCREKCHERTCPQPDDYTAQDKKVVDCKHDCDVKRLVCRWEARCKTKSSKKSKDFIREHEPVTYSLNKCCGTQLNLSDTLNQRSPAQNCTESGMNCNAVKNIYVQVTEASKRGRDKPKQIGVSLNFNKDGPSLRINDGGSCRIVNDRNAICGNDKCMSSEDSNPGALCSVARNEYLQKSFKSEGTFCRPENFMAMEAKATLCPSNVRLSEKCIEVKPSDFSEVTARPSTKLYFCTEVPENPPVPAVSPTSNSGQYCPRFLPDQYSQQYPPMNAKFCDRPVDTCYFNNASSNQLPVHQTQISMPQAGKCFRPCMVSCGSQTAKCANIRNWQDVSSSCTSDEGFYYRHAHTPTPYGTNYFKSFESESPTEKTCSYFPGAYSHQPRYFYCDTKAKSTQCSFNNVNMIPCRQKVNVYTTRKSKNVGCVAKGKKDKLACDIPHDFFLPNSCRETAQCDSASQGRNQSAPRRQHPADRTKITDDFDRKDVHIVISPERVRNKGCRGTEPEKEPNMYRKIHCRRCEIHGPRETGQPLHEHGSGGFILKKKRFVSTGTTSSPAQTPSTAVSSSEENPSDSSYSEIDERDLKQLKKHLIYSILEYSGKNSENR